MKTIFPYLRKRDKGKYLRIEVMADSMRVGKTTAVKVIAGGMRGLGKSVTESYEDWQNNPYLKQSYADPANNFLQSQKWFVKRKWEQIRDGGDGEIFVQDVPPEMDYCYAETNRRLGRMSATHFAEYNTFYHSLDWDMAPAPDLLIYLQISDVDLIKRAEASKREFETVDPDYFLMMKAVNREWLDSIPKSSDYTVLIVDTDRLDFANDASHKQKLLDMVAQFLV